ncbi:MAG: DUF1385 domain-containing protein [Myxococcota bacterium]|jgi:uncharacterized protein YqhQ|nr:DUF1385 domain-containing protein [Myxococcota bacterium]
MMRSPRSFVVVCRRPDSTIVLKEARWVSLWDRLRFLRWPFLRGAVVFWETLQNGMQALTFSAEQQAGATPEEASSPPAGATPADAGAPTPASAATAEPPLSKGAITGTILVSLLFAFGLFAALPHLLAFLTGKLTGAPLDGRNFLFQVVDGGFKLLVLVAYMWGVSRMKEIQRVFQYHGAEHKAIFTYEAGEPLTLEHARKYRTFHPRCGTSFLILVLLVSILTFTLAFSGPWMPVFSENQWLNQLLYVLIKLPLMFPIAGIAYEVLKLSGKRANQGWLKPLILPGLWLQRITTKEPSDDQLEIALLSLRKVLWREQRIAAGDPLPPGATGGFRDGQIELLSTAAEADLPLVAGQLSAAAAHP